MKETLRTALLNAGAAQVGFAKAGEISSDINLAFEEWIKQDHHGEMAYLQRHLSLRKNTDNVLPEAKTVICMAFDYRPKNWRDDSLSYVAAYAYGEDYHNYIRRKLKSLLEDFKKTYGGKWRVCIDSAPLAERYWALKSGIGSRGLNGNVTVDGCGPFCFLTEILTTIEIEPDLPSTGKCLECGKCIKICPTQALKGNGLMDARRCINYLTIEKKSEFNEEENNMLRKENGFLFGCDLCLRICPHYERKKDGLDHKDDMKIYPEIMNLCPQEILEMSEEEFSKRFAFTPLIYAGYEKLKRNARALLNKRKTH